MQIPSSSPPEGDAVWRRRISLISRSLWYPPHTFLSSVWAAVFLQRVGEHLLAAVLFPSVFFFNSYRWVSNSICHVVLSLHGAWSAADSAWFMAPGLRSSPNICSTGLKCFLLWDESHTNILLRPALLSFFGLVDDTSHFPSTKTHQTQMGHVEKLHGVLNVSVFDWMNHVLIYVLAAMQPNQWKIQQNHMRISLVRGGSQYDHCLCFLVWLSVCIRLHLVSGMVRKSGTNDVVFLNVFNWLTATFAS